MVRNGYNWLQKIQTNHIGLVGLESSEENDFKDSGVGVRRADLEEKIWNHPRLRAVFELRLSSLLSENTRGYVARPRKMCNMWDLVSWVSRTVRVIKVILIGGWRRNEFYYECACSGWDCWKFHTNSCVLRLLLNPHLSCRESIHRHICTEHALVPYRADGAT